MSKIRYGDPEGDPEQKSGPIDRARRK